MTIQKSGLAGARRRVDGVDAGVDCAAGVCGGGILSEESVSGDAASGACPVLWRGFCAEGEQIGVGWRRMTM